jgi:hypothetical protein
VGKPGAPGKIRTPNLLIRSQTLYPVELRALSVAMFSNGKSGGNYSIAIELATFKHTTYFLLFHFFSYQVQK